MKINKEKLKFLKKSVVTFLIIIGILISIYSISITVQKLKSPDKTPTFFGFKTFVVLSGSMEPELNIGDIIIVKEVDDNKLKVGDIVSYKNSQTVTTHRITEISKKADKTYFKTKGDANNTEDDKLVEENIIEGKLVTSIPKIGNLTILLNNRSVIIVIAVMIFCYLMFSNKEKEEEEEEII